MPSGLCLWILSVPYLSRIVSKWQIKWHQQFKYSNIKSSSTMQWCWYYYYDLHQSREQELKVNHFPSILSWLPRNNNACPSSVSFIIYSTWIFLDTFYKCWHFDPITYKGYFHTTCDICSLSIRNVTYINRVDHKLIPWFPLSILKCQIKWVITTPFSHYCL